MGRRIVWGVPSALVVIGLLVLLLAHLQPAYTATVVEVGETSYTPARRMVRGHSSAYYREALTVEYADDRGQTAVAEVWFGTTNPNSLPQAGDGILISRGVSGMVVHPSRNLIAIGGSAALIGGLFLMMFLLVRLDMRRR